MNMIVNPKEWFFDRAKVLDRIDAARIKALSKIGSFIRRTAKGSIKSAGKKQKVSEPGQPPRSRTGLLKDFIFFTYDPETQSVVVGPSLINRPTGAPSILEHGGTAQVFEMRLPTWVAKERGLAPPQWRRFNPARLPTDPRFRRETRTRKAVVAQRPFMQPALEKETKNDKLRDAWQNVL